ncbi:MAG: glycosyltransferase family 9 protein [Bacteroidota bacterium]
MSQNLGVNVGERRVELKRDCEFFRGDVPCKPHKLHGVHCVDEDGSACRYYVPVDRKILIIKLGAIGDVIRTSPLLRRLRDEYPRSEIWWMTYSREVVPSLVDVILDFSPQSVTTLRATHFDFLYNLDKELEACALANLISADTKKGYCLQNGKCAPMDEDAEHKFLTGVFDDLNKANTKSYPEEIFEMCGFRFSRERYILDNFASDGYRWELNKKNKIVGLNTGCGGRWSSRLWPEKYWIALAKRLKKAGYLPLLLGGEQEHKKNLKIAKASGAKYLGHFPLRQFINLVDQCDLVVTAVTMAAHIAIGLGKKIILFNNVFNKNEFELYGLGEILEPEFDCTCFYSPTCPNNCMQYLSVDRVFGAVGRLLETT